MNRPSLDSGALALGLAAIGFGVVLLMAGQLSVGAVQPILAVVLAAAGGIGLLIHRGTSRNRNNK